MFLYGGIIITRDRNFSKDTYQRGDVYTLIMANVLEVSFKTSTKTMERDIFPFSGD